MTCERKGCIMGCAQDPEDSAPVGAIHSAGPLRSVAGWAAGLSNLTKLVVAVTGLLVAFGGLIVALGLGPDNPSGKRIETTPGGVAAAPPVLSDHCATNHYTVHLPGPSTYAGVYKDASTHEFIKWKRDGDEVTGPSSRDNLSNGYLEVYTPDSRDRIGWMWADSLRYDGCTPPGSLTPIGR